MGRLWRERNGRTSVQVLSEFFVTATRKLSLGPPREQAWEHVVALSAWDPQATDFLVLELGVQVQSRRGLSWWDSLIVAAAHRQGRGTLLTKDLQHGAVYAGVTVLDPFRTGVQEARKHYAPQLASLPLRGRGRPRKTAATD